VEYILGVAMVVGLAWLLLSDLGLPALPWFERHRAVRPMLLVVLMFLILALLGAVARKLL
jgi:hypothetical protein